jgi:hypothetical protein
MTGENEHREHLKHWTAIDCVAADTAAATKRHSNSLISAIDKANVSCHNAAVSAINSTLGFSKRLAWSL